MATKAAKLMGPDHAPPGAPGGPTVRSLNRLHSNCSEQRPCKMSDIINCSLQRESLICRIIRWNRTYILGFIAAREYNVPFFFLTDNAVGGDKTGGNFDRKGNQCERDSPRIAAVPAVEIHESAAFAHKSRGTHMTCLRGENAADTPSRTPAKFLKTNPDEKSRKTFSTWENLMRSLFSLCSTISFGVGHSIASGLMSLGTSFRLTHARIVHHNCRPIAPAHVANDPSAERPKIFFLFPGLPIHVLCIKSRSVNLRATTVL